VAKDRRALKKRKLFTSARRGRSFPELEEAYHLLSQKKKILPGTRRGRSSLEPEQEGLVRNQKRQILFGAKRGSSCSEPEEKDFVWGQPVLLISQKCMSLPEPGSSSPEPEGHVPAEARMACVCRNQRSMSLPELGSSSPEPEGHFPVAARRAFPCHSQKGMSLPKPEWHVFVGTREACPCRSQAALLWSQKGMSLQEPGSSSLEPEGNVPPGTRQFFSGARRDTSEPHGVLGSKEFPTLVFLRFRS
jgi:hypothetical protein